MKLNGIVKWFDNGKGYGFINPLKNDNDIDESKEYFVHFSSIKIDGFKTLQPDQKVSFSLKESDKGNQAIEVCPIK
jgi:cold shock protein